MTVKEKFKVRLEEIDRLADALDRQKANLMEAAAEDAGFPVKITSFEVDLAVDHLRTMEQEISWIENGDPYGTVATIFPYDAPTVVLARFGGAALLTGNRLRFSLSSQTPRTAALLGEICKSFVSIEAVVGMDNRKFGQRCVDDKDVKLLFISGASAVGEVYRKQHKSLNIDISDLELFGPLLLLVPFDDPDKAASELIQTRYGFLLSFFGSCSEKIKTLFYDHFGMVHDNPDFTFTPLRLPFGGKKASGWILERHGDHWLERDGAFLYSKELVLNKRSSD